MIPILHSSPNPESLKVRGLGTMNHGHGTRVAPGVSPYDYTKEQVQEYARLCRDGGLIENYAGSFPVVAGSPVTLDYEGYENPTAETIPPDRRRPDLSVADVAKIVRQHGEWFKEIAPNPLAFIYPTFSPIYWDWEYERGLTTEQLNRIDQDFAQYRLVHDLSDFVTNGHYIGSRASYDQSAKMADGVAQQLRRLMPGKPHAFWITDIIGTENIPVPPEMAPRYIEDSIRSAGPNGMLVLFPWNNWDGIAKTLLPFLPLMPDKNLNDLSVDELTNRIQEDVNELRNREQAANALAKQLAAVRTQVTASLQ